jgi:eukaryotic-like serine/threonine-protein kinase
MRYASSGCSVRGNEQETAVLQRFLERPAAERRIGPLELCEQLGRGGFAPVWLGREIYGQTELRTAAVKLFALDAQRSRIVDEARALCRVEHPNVVRFHGLHIDEANGVMALAMEHVAGRSFEAVLGERGRLEADEVLALGVAVASALAAAHRAGLVHRDVKPANVLDAAGVPKLIDFGIAAPGAARVEIEARVVGRGKTSAGATTQRFDAMTGTPGYVDPACVAGGLQADVASDLYGLGAMLYRALAGRLPAAARDDAPDLVPDVLEGRSAPPPVAELAPRTPPALARVIDALCAPDRRARPSSAEWVAVALEQVRRELAGGRRALPPEDIGPFRGLGRYGEDDRDVHFGRASEVAAALEMLKSRGLVALVGPSGCGKSSLGRAGILPAVRDGALGRWPPAWDALVIEPGADPRAAIAASLAPYIPDAATRAPDDLAAAVAERAAAVDRGLVLMVDQLEELATLAAGESRAHALAFLARLAEPIHPGVRLLCAVRRDLLDPLLATPLGRPLVRGSVLIEPLTDVAWAIVVEQALDAYGYRFEDDALADEIADEIHRTGGAMPLVQFALAELWDRRDRVGKTLPRAALDAMGGLAGALERHADATFAELVKTELYGEEAARTVLLALTTPQGTRVTRTDAELERVAGLRAPAVVRAFERARLVVRGQDGVTLAHEALLGRWRRLRGWVAEAREDRLLAAELEADARRFREQPDAVRPWRRHRLAFGEALLARGEIGVSDAARAFLGASRSAERRARVVAAAVAAGVLLTAGLGATAYVRAVQRQEAIATEALGRERAARQDAERTTQDVQAAQARIDELVAAMADSPTKDEVLALQERIRRGTEDQAPESPRAPVARAAAPPPEPTAVPTASPPPPPPERLQVEKTW